jgi:hypothetical protein
MNVEIVRNFMRFCAQFLRRISVVLPIKIFLSQRKKVGILNKNIFVGRNAAIVKWVKKVKNGKQVNTTRGSIHVKLKNK